MPLPQSFKLRIQDLAGVPFVDNDATTADDTALQQFLVDACYDVVYRVSSTSPEILSRFTTNTSGSVWTNGTVIDTYREIISVYRSGNRCHLGNSRYHDSYGDSDSIHYATSHAPVFYIYDGGLYIMPSAVGAYEIHHIPDYTIDIDVLTITDFPKSYHEHICLYSAIRVLDYRVQETIEEDEDGEMMAMLRGQQQKLQADYEGKFIIQGGGRK